MYDRESGVIAENVSKYRFMKYDILTLVVNAVCLHVRYTNCNDGPLLSMILYPCRLYLCIIGPHWFHELQRSWFEQRSQIHTEVVLLTARHCVCFVVHFVVCSLSLALSFF